MQDFKSITELESQELTAESFEEIAENHLDVWIRDLDNWIVARYLYPTPVTYMSDEIYSIYMDVYRQLCMNGYLLKEETLEKLRFEKIVEYLELYYEGDPFPENELRELNISNEVIEQLRNLKNAEELKPEWKSLEEFKAEKILLNGKMIDKYSEEVEKFIQDIVQEDPPKSIKPLESMQEVWEWFKTKRDVEMCASLKMDGINLRLFYINGYFTRALTRGRAGEVRDYTLIISKVVPHYIEENGQGITGIIRVEAYVQPDSLQYFRDNYKANYVVPRTAVTTLLTVPHKEEDYKYLQVHAFNYKCGDTLDEGFKFLEKNGFLTAPRKLVKFTGLNYEEFKIWINELLGEMKEIEISQGKKCDGLVIEVNSRKEYEQLIVDGMYDDGNIAAKIGPWQPLVYDAVVKNILIDRSDSRMRFHCKVEIEPVVTQSGLTVSIVNMFNLGLLQKYGVRVGSKIKFKFKNDNASEWYYSSK